MSPSAIFSGSDAELTPATPPGATNGDRLRAVVRAVTIRSAERFEIAGRAVALNGAAPAPAWPGSPVHPVPIVERLRQELYQHAYCRDVDAGDAPDAANADDEADVALARALSAANRGRERWDAGWTVQSMLPSGQVIAAKGTATRTLWPGEYVFPSGRGMGVGPGATVTAYSPKESWTVQPGYYYALGAVADEQDDHDLARVYWNVGVNGAAPLVEHLTAAFTRFDLPFRFKCQAYAAAYARDDAAVLFVARRHFHLAAELIAAALPRLRPHLRARTPLLAKRLAPGVAAADDPGGGDSFGTHRCGVIAEGIWAAFERGETTEDARFASVERSLAARGVNLAAPYLNRDSTDIYELPPAGA